MKLKYIIQRVQRILKESSSINRYELSPMYIYDKLSSARNILLNRKVRSNQKISEFSYQSINNIILGKYYLTDVNIGKELLRSKKEIPNMIMNNDRYLIQTVSNSDGTMSYSNIDYSAYKYQKYNKYTSKRINYFIKNGYIYLINDPTLTHISITAIFSDIISAYIYSEVANPPDKYMNYMELDFHIDNNMEDALIDLVIPEIMMSINRKDESNKKKNKSEKDRE